MSDSVLDELSGRRPRRAQPPRRTPPGARRQPAEIASPAPAERPPDEPAAADPPAAMGETQAATTPVPSPRTASPPLERRMVNVHARLDQDQYERLTALVRAVEAAGLGQTSKIELIQMLVSELPTEPDEEFARRLRVFRAQRAISQQA